MPPSKKSSSVNKNFFLIFFAAFFLISLFSCATMGTEKQYLPVEKAVRAGKFEEAAGKYKKIRKNKNDELLLNIDLGLLGHFAGQYEQSAVLLNDAHKQAEYESGKNFAEHVSSVILNENLSKYYANVYEYLYLNVFNALNYYHAGNIDEAMVEVRRISNKQREYMWRYGEILVSENARAIARLREMKADAASVGVDIDTLNQNMPSLPDTDGIFRDSSLARYVSMMIRLLKDDDENARVDAQVLATLSGGFDVSGPLNIDAGKGRLDFLAFGGLIGRRREETLYFPPDFFPLPFIFLPTSNGVDIPPFRLKFAYPIYSRNFDKNEVRNVRVRLSSGQEKVLPLLEDLCEAVKKDVEARAAATLATSIVRTIAKKAAAVAAGTLALADAKKSAKESGSFGSSLAYNIAYLGVAAAIDAVDLTESADVRQCIFLPGAAYAGGFMLAPGKYSGQIDFLDTSGKIVQSEKFTDIEVRANYSTLVESFCPK